MDFQGSPLVPEKLGTYLYIYCLSLELNMLCDCDTRGCGNHSSLTTAETRRVGVLAMPSGAVLEGRTPFLQPNSAGQPGITRQRVGLPLKIFQLNSLLLLLPLYCRFRPSPNSVINVSPLTTAAILEWRRRSAWGGAAAARRGQRGEVPVRPGSAGRCSPCGSPTFCLSFGINSTWDTSLHTRILFY